MAIAKVRTNFHQARWDEPIIYEMSTPGVRGILPPDVEPEIAAQVGDVAAKLPASIKRQAPAPLPEVDQKHVLEHWVHLSQETMGSNLSNDISEGTCTMKYNPRVNEDLHSNPNFAELHPLQDIDTCQGALEILYRFEQMIKEVSGMDRVTFQPSGGNHAVYTGASIMRKYHADRGESNRNVAITTIFSHPCDAACPATVGFELVTIYPDERGVPDIEALKAAVKDAGDNLAGIFMTNPEDIGIYNPRIDEFVKIVHDAGGLCYYDQANANAFLGVVRAREAGVDMCHFNVHKTFGTPHGCSGPANGAVCVRDFLAPYLPTPTVEFDGEKYWLDYDRPESIGKVRDFLGTTGVILKAYAWMMNMGAEGIRECADVSVINNNYMRQKMLKIKGLGESFAGNGIQRQEQIRYTWEELQKDTGVGTDDVNCRLIDFGIPWYWSSHHPWVVPEPMTLEPCETFSKADLDSYVATVEHVAKEAYADPEIAKSAPHRSCTHRVKNPEEFDDPAKWATTWSAYVRKNGRK
jgi:glycine dehydrogenase subunit 2